MHPVEMRRAPPRRSCGHVARMFANLDAANRAQDKIHGGRQGSGSEEVNRLGHLATDPVQSGVRNARVTVWQPEAPALRFVLREEPR